MINVIYGAKGSGKTQKIIDAANAAVSKGEVIYITDNNEESLNIANTIRYLNAKEYAVKDETSFEFFLKGLIAGNSDVNMVFVDGAGRLLDKTADKLEPMMKVFDKLSSDYGIDFTVTVSIAEPPKFLKKYL